MPSFFILLLHQQKSQQFMKSFYNMTNKNSVNTQSTTATLQKFKKLSHYIGYHYLKQHNTSFNLTSHKKRKKDTNSHFLDHLS